ncbi:MAG: tRNA (adenosine(37)-N6)-threonylcarbamoyltransferase complex transferase subunit TsaD [Candidatus Omnitrophica bacterium]|nr:tRNA (adenosine(37)-N6)-threonylcarbamoyltransferase complex transferase subunit TsaD [Candidatus Omnitrophota bacterium]
MITLGIETSCDETGVSVTDGRKVLANVVSSSVHLHKKYGGVVPEIASRFHVEYIVEMMKKAIAISGKNLKDIRLVAVTNGPGLVGALLTGISVAKALSYSLGVPLIGVNHILAHLYSSFLGNGGVRFPFVGLVVSGGHTVLFYCEDTVRYKLLGQTQDDAVGEAYDKVAKLLGLGYPGGPIVDKMARSAKRLNKIIFPKSYLGKHSLDFSFSGIKTAVLYYVQRVTKANTEDQKLDKSLVADICYAFQEAATDALVEKACLACAMRRCRRIVVGGGVAANSRLREKLYEAAALNGIAVHFPKMEYCLDNAAMVSFLGEQLYARGQRSNMYLTAEPNLGPR